MMKKAIVGSMFLLLAQGCLEEGGSKGQSKGSSALFTAYDSTQGGCLQSSSGMNCNHYKDMNSVYVTGSNANDGEYFFAVLTPGSQNGGFFEGAQGNLSDTVAWSANGDLGKGDQKSNRTFTVLNGRVTYSGSHHIGRDTLGRPIVQLAPFDRTDNPGGVYKVAVCMKDATGPSSCKYDSFKIGENKPSGDLIAPVVAILNPINGALMSRSIQFEATASDDNFESMACSVADLDLGTSSLGQIMNVVDSTMFSDGSLTFTCQARDTYGNMSSAVTTIEIDNTPPLLAIDSPSNGSAIAGVSYLLGSAYDAHPGSSNCSIDGVPFLSTLGTELHAALNTLSIIDGDSLINCDSVDQLGNSSQTQTAVTIDNMSIKVMPQTLNLVSNGKQNSVTVQISGVNVALLTPIQSKDLRLRVPGGFDVAVNVEFGSGGSGDSLMIKFDRQQLIASIRAGIANGMITIESGATLGLFSGERKIGSDWIKILE